MVIMVTVLCLLCAHAGQVHARESYTISAPVTIENEVEWGNKDINYSSSSIESPVITVKSGGVLKITKDSHFHLETFRGLTAIKVEEGGKLLIDNSTFDAPNAANDDAFILIDGGEIQIIKSSLKGTNTSASGNYLRVTGGSLTMDSSNVSVSVNSFSASYPGIISTVNSAVQLKDSSFMNCVVSKGGVVSAFEDTSFHAVNIKSDGNSSAQTLSGMIFAWKTDVVVEGESDFDGRKKSGNMLKHIYINSGSLEIADGSKFHDNIGADGSAIYALTSNIRIGNVLFTDNKSTASQQACGTVYIKGGDLTLNGTKFENNTAKIGGAICMFSSGTKGSQFTINDALFEKNTAQYGGGAIYLNTDHNLQPELRINSAEFKENQSSTNPGEAGAIYATNSGYSYDRKGWDIYMSRAVFKENTGARVGGAIALFEGSYLEILPRNGAVIFGNNTVSSPEETQDIYVNEQGVDTYKLSETMFNGYDFGWQEIPVDFSSKSYFYTNKGMVINADPTGRNYSGAAVVFENNSSLPDQYGYTLGAGGAVTLDFASRLFIGEDAADEFTIKKIWDNQVVEYGLKKDPAAFLASLRLFANGDSYALGDPVQVEKTTGTDGKDHYLFSFSADPGTFASVEDAHDDKYLVTFKTLPKYIDGEVVTYSVSEVTDGDYLPEVRGSMAEGFELTNKLNPYNDPLPVRVVWNDNNNSHGDRPAPEDYMASLILYINEEAADWGNISLSEKTTDESGTVSYRFTAENMPDAVLRLKDAENNIYEITLEHLPRFIAGVRPEYAAGQQPLPNYQTDIEVSDGITVILNTWQGPQPGPHPEPQPGPHPGWSFFRLDPGLRELPKTGFSTRSSQALPSDGKVKTYEPGGFTMMIPSISVEAEIVRVPFDGSNYPVEGLENNVGLLDGSDAPGQGHSILTGHNHLNAVAAGPFALVSSLTEGDRIFILNARDEVQTFIVSASDKIAYNDVSGFEAIVNRYPNALTLLTCEDEAESGGYAARRVISAVLYDSEAAE